MDSTAVLKRLTASCPDGPDKPEQDAALIYMTPDVARKELETSNDMNRHLDPYEVQAIADIITNGRWAPNGETIGYDTNEQVTNGQHRYAGIAKSGQPVWVWVVTGLDPAVRPTIDDHKRRTFRDDLTMNKIPGGTLIEQTQRKVMYWEFWGGMARQGTTRHRVMRVDLAVWYAGDPVTGEPGRGHEVTAAIDAVRDYPRVPLSTANKAFIWWLLTRYAPESTVSRFFSIMSIGSQSPDDDVVVVMRDRIYRDRVTAKGDKNLSRGNTPEHIWLIIRAWNAWLLGEKLSVLNLPARGPVNPYPQPVEVLTKAPVKS